MDGEFDGIVVGGGYNGLTYGGATITDEVTRPGFYHNLHANFVWSYGAPHQDLELHRYSLRLMHGEVERCYLFEDGSTLTTF